MAACSSARSAYIRLSLACSASSSRSCRTSDTDAPPYLLRHLKNGALLTPCVRHRSGTGTPLSASRRMPTIWVSLNLDFRMTAPWTRAVYVQLSIDRGSLRLRQLSLRGRPDNVRCRTSLMAACSSARSVYIRLSLACSASSSRSCRTSDPDAPPYTGAIVGVTVQGADQGDTTTIAETLTTAAEDLEAAAAVTDDETRVIDEVVADKGYHSKQVLVDLAALDLRTYIAEPDRGRRKWTKHSAARDAVYANRRRIRGARGRRLQRRRSAYLERPNAHLYETGGMRRTHLRGHANILKRLLVHVGGFNLGLLMRTVFGVGTPPSLQGQLAVLIGVVVALWGARHDLWSPRDTRFTDHEAMFTPYRHLELLPVEASACGL